MTEPTVHVVDDDGPFLLAMSRLLRASGFSVRTYVSATDFLAQREEDGDWLDAREEILQIAAACLQFRRVLLQTDRQLRMAHGSRQVVRDLRQLPFGAMQFLQLRHVHPNEGGGTCAARESGEWLSNSWKTTECTALGLTGARVAFD